MIRGPEVSHFVVPTGRCLITLSTEALALVANFVDTYGEAALNAALGSIHLFDPGMRRGSTLAVESAGAFVEEGVPCALVYTFHPRAKKTGERTMVRLLTGESKAITVELPPAPE